MILACRPTTAPRPRSRSPGALLPGCLLGLVLLAASAHAEFRGQSYSVERPKLAIDLSYRFESEARTGPFIDTRNDSQVLRERFDIETAGWLYHPALATYTLRLSPEWEQTQDESDPGRDSDSNSFLLGYGVETTLLPFKPYTVNLYARRQNSILDSSLATRSESETDAYGARLMLKYRVLPTILSYDHSTSEQRGFFDSDEDRDEYRLDMRHERPNSDTQLKASYVEQGRVVQGFGTDTENLFAVLLNNYQLRPDNQVLLTSLASYRDSRTETASLSSNASGFTLSETLHWRHSKTFSTNYNLQYMQDDNDTLSVNRTLASAGLSHSLYENLVTTASVSGSSSSQGEDNYGGNLNLNYQRRIPGGMIFASMGQDYRVTNRNTGGEVLQVTDEALTLTTGDVTLLEIQNVDLDSILVTSDDGATLYAPNLDYTVTLIGTSVRISRVPLGGIAEGQSVLVDYRYLSNPPYDDSVYTQTYGLGLSLWDAWRINYRYIRSEQEVLDGPPPDILTDDTTHLVDTDLTWKWSTTRALYENSKRAAGTSLARWRIEETLRFQPSNRAYISASGYYGHTRFKDTDSDETFYGLRSDLQWQLSGRSRLRLEALYQVTEGTSVNTVDTGASALWEWSYGIWRAEASYRFLREEDQDIDQTRDINSIFLNLRRDLF